MKVTCEVEDILSNWPKVRYAIQQASLIVPEKDRDILVYNMACEILTGIRKIWILHDGVNIRAIIGAIIQKSGGATSIPSIIISPVFGFSPMTDEDRILLKNGFFDFAKNNKCNVIYAYSANPKVWVIAEKTDMTFVAKVYKWEVT